MKTDWIQKILSARITFMVVPHGGSRPRQINIHLSVIFLVTLTWAGITFWGSYLSAQHVDYWRSQMSNQAMKIKMKYLLAQLDQSREYIDEVKTVDAQLRQLIQYQNEAPIVKNDQPLKAETPLPGGTGGPTLMDATELTRFMQGTEPDLAWPTIVNKVALMKNEAVARMTSLDSITKWIEMQRRLFRATPRGWPCEGYLSSHYGQRKSPFDGTEEFHPGIDICNSHGTAVRATADGIVRLASWNSGYGNLVLLQHEFGFSTRYAHNSKFLVRAGEQVKRGQVLALMGTTGKSSGVHCHYEVWRNNVRKNPIPFLREDPKFSGKNQLASVH